MSKVLVVNDGGHDLSQAEHFGDLVVMSDKAISRYATTVMNRLFKPFIEESKEEDFILLSGLTVMNVIACSLFAAKHGRLNLLIHRQGKQSRYMPRTIMMEKEEEDVRVNQAARDLGRQ